MQQHSDALLRETVIAHLGELHSTPEAPSSLAPAIGYDGGELESQIQGALADSAFNADLTLLVREDAAESCRNISAALDAADEAARRGALLVPAALPELRECRRWFLGQVADQLRGRDPTPWRPRDAAVRDPEGLLAHVDHATILDQLADGIVLGDDQNHIIYANTAAEQLLGWEPGELIGRRVTAIIPPRLRDAHVAGYTRFLLTGEARLLGSPIRVPARHRSGREIPVELKLNGFRTDEGRHVFTASLRDLTDRVELERRVTIADSVHATAEMVATLAQSRQFDSIADAAPIVLNTIGPRLGWQFGAVWLPEDGALRCAEIWDERPGAHAAMADSSRERRFASGQGLPGRVWRSAEPTWITDVAADANFPRMQAALADGLRTALAFPVKAHGEVLAVVELYTGSVLDPDPELLATAGTIGSLVALLVR
jgi:PAS domain S-box-containing protein